MAQKLQESEQGLPEWVMSYADMITILMAFFVVMYSMAGNKDTTKELAVLRALRNQFGPMMNGWGAITPDEPPHSRSSQFNFPYQGGTKRKDRNQGGADQQRVPEGDHTRVHAPWPGEQSRIGGVIYFVGDTEQLNQQQEHVLKLIAKEIDGKPQKIEIRGHSARRFTKRDQSPQDGWDLAYARTRATMNYLTSLGIDRERIRLGVAGENEPIGEGGTPVQNSRVEVFLLNEVTAGPKTQPAKDGAAPRKLATGTEAS